VLSNHKKKNLGVLCNHQATHLLQSPLVRVPLWVQLPDTLPCRMVGYQTRCIDLLQDVYHRGENAYTLANLHNFQSMFKAGQLLCVIVLDSASLLVSIRTQSFESTRSLSLTSHAYESALTRPLLPQPQLCLTLVTFTRW